MDSEKHALVLASQVIANTASVLDMGDSPHDVLLPDNKSTVDVDFVPFQGFRTPEAKWHKVCAAA